MDETRSAAAASGSSPNFCGEVGRMAAAEAVGFVPTACSP
jgi:hypothetical protein